MTTARRAHPSSEELVLYGLIGAIGAIPVTVALVGRATFGVDETLGLIMMAIGLVGTLVSFARTRRPQRD